MRWRLKAADDGHAGSCLELAARMYGDHPYARAVGHVEEAVRIATPAEVMEGHDVPLNVLTSVVLWLRRGGHNAFDELARFRREALEGAKHCRNAGCEVVGHLKDFKACPQCKTARYCSDACQKEDWTTGGHKATCGTYTPVDTLDACRRIALEGARQGLTLVYSSAQPEPSLTQTTPYTPPHTL
jgi:hypothetical protein